LNNSSGHSVLKKCPVAKEKGRNYLPKISWKKFFWPLSAELINFAIEENEPMFTYSIDFFE
jgi:hypothetical protein